MTTVHAVRRKYENINKDYGRPAEWKVVSLCFDGEGKFGADTTEVADLVTCERCRELLVDDVRWYLQRMGVGQ